MPCAPISTASAASSPPSRASAPPAASSSRSISSRSLIIAGIGIVRRAGARRADALRGTGGARLDHPGAGARTASIPARLRMAALFGLLVTLAFAIAAARPGARRAGDGAVPRDGLRGGRPAAQTLCRMRRVGIAVAAGAARDLVLRRPAHRRDLRRRRDLLLHRAAQRRRARAVACAGRARACARRRCGSRSATSTAPAR